MVVEMGKTETIRKRSVTVYAHTEKQRERWVRYAKKRKMGVSAAFNEVMEAAISNTLPEHEDVMRQLQEENERLRLELEERDRDLRRKEILLSTYERQLASRSFTRYSGADIRNSRLSPELLDLLRRAGRPLTQQDIVSGLNIDPNDTEVMRGLEAQLDDLTELEKVTYTMKGWCWNDRE